MYVVTGGSWGEACLRRDGVVFRGLPLGSGPGIRSLSGGLCCGRLRGGCVLAAGTLGVVIGFAFVRHGFLPASFRFPCPDLLRLLVLLILGPDAFSPRHPFRGKDRIFRRQQAELADGDHL